MAYGSPASAAPDIETLIDHLTAEERPGARYVYRGQVRDWPGPLLPSLYRRSVRRDREFTPRDREYELSLRKCGRHFVEMKPDSAVEWVGAQSAGPSLTRSEGEAMVALADNPDFARLVASEGHERA